MTNFIQIITTVGKKKEAQQISNSLLARKLIACAQIIGPVTSSYPWKGKIQSNEEWQCIFKTRSDLFNATELLIKEIHPYELPEIISTPILNGSKEYFDWLADNLRK